MQANGRRQGLATGFCFLLHLLGVDSQGGNVVERQIVYVLLAGLHHLSGLLFILDGGTEKLFGILRCLHCGHLDDQVSQYCRVSNSFYLLPDRIHNLWEMLLDNIKQSLLERFLAAFLKTFLTPPFTPFFQDFLIGFRVP
jgi:hypothetical protein